MSKKKRGKEIENRVADSIHLLEKKRVRQARTKKRNHELMNRMRKLTETDSVAGSFLESALAEIRPRKGKKGVHD